MKIAVIGSGVVGQATGKGLIHHGHEVVFSDTNPLVLRKLGTEGYQTRSPSGVLNGAEVLMLSVSTPTVDGKIELGFIEAAAATLGQQLAESDDYHVVVVRSTVPPGTTRKLAGIIEEFSGKEVGRDFGLCMNPEFLRATSAEEDFRSPWIIVFGALDNRSAEYLGRVYEPFGEIPIVTTDLRTAEAVKYTHNLYNATKISYTNEMWRICRELGIDGNSVMEVVSRSAEGMWNAQYGTRGGFPYGGSCLPKDTTAFLSFANENGWDMPLLRAVIEVNERMRREAGK